MAVKPKTNYRVGIAMSVVLVGVAGVFDAASLIPFVGSVMGPIFWLVSGVYLWTKGVGLFGGKKLAISAISFVAEIAPAVQALPMLTAGIIGVLLVIRIEDKTGMSLVKPMKAGITPPRLRRTTPLNSEPGVRPPRNKPAEYTEDENSAIAL